MWSNNSQFSKCLFEKEFDEDTKQYNKMNKNNKEKETTKKFNIFLRDIYETMANNEQNIDGIQKNLSKKLSTFNAYINFLFIPYLSTLCIQQSIRLRL